MISASKHAPWCKPDCGISTGSRQEVLENQLEHFLRAFDDCQRHHSTDNYATHLCDCVNVPSGKDHQWAVRAGCSPVKGQKCFCGEVEI